MVVCNILKGKVERIGEQGVNDFRSKRGKLLMQNKEGISTARVSPRYKNILDTTRLIWI